MATTSNTLEISQLKQGRVTLRLIGTTPLYFNAMSAKAMRTLLIGGGKKTAAEKRELKHDPEQEFRDSTYRLADGPTLLGFPALVSPMAGRKAGGGYHPFSPDDPSAVAELRRQGAQALRGWLARYRGIAEMGGLDVSPIEEIAGQLSGSGVAGAA